MVCRSRSRSRTDRAEWYVAPSHSTPNTNRPGFSGWRIAMSIKNPATPRLCTTSNPRSFNAAPKESSPDRSGWPTDPLLTTNLENDRSIFSNSITDFGHQCRVISHIDSTRDSGEITGNRIGRCAYKHVTGLSSANVHGSFRSAHRGTIDELMRYYDQENSRRPVGQRDFYLPRKTMVVASCSGNSNISS